MIHKNAAACGKLWRYAPGAGQKSETEGKNGRDLIFL